MICTDEKGAVIGSLNTSYSPDASRVVIEHIDFEMGSQSVMMTGGVRPEIQSLALEIRDQRLSRRFSVTEVQIATQTFRCQPAAAIELLLRKSLKYEVPEDARFKCVEPLENYEYEASLQWRVAVVPEALSEKVFDLDQFTPA